MKRPRAIVAVIAIVGSIVALIISHQRANEFRAGATVQILPYAVQDFQGLLTHRPPELGGLLITRIDGTDLWTINADAYDFASESALVHEAIEFLIPWGQGSADSHWKEENPDGVLFSYTSAVMVHELNPSKAPSINRK